MERDVNVHHMTLADGAYMQTALVGLLVVILVDYGNDLLGGEVVDVALA